MKLFFTLSVLLMTSQAHASLRCVSFNFNGEHGVSVYDGEKSLADLSFGKSKEKQAKGLKECMNSLDVNVCTSISIEKSPGIMTPAKVEYENLITDKSFTTLGDCRAEAAISAAGEVL